MVRFFHFDAVRPSLYGKTIPAAESASPAIFLAAKGFVGPAVKAGLMQGRAGEVKPDLT
jgi:hypothetical protein